MNGGRCEPRPRLGDLHHSIPIPHATETQKGRIAIGSRSTLKYREEIPKDSIELTPRSEESLAPAGTPGPTQAPAWDEELPPELRQVVRQYFKAR